ncbi:hypothetical protein, partial [Clostridioides difficile]|uniref:hypothetical protein n=1 Tax=Clostridioides difficile TaxID=1496 RepID=UPI001033D514
MFSGQIEIGDGDQIDCIDESARIKYLGCSFNSELVFDISIIKTISDKQTNLTASPLLKTDQKLNIMNQYLMPLLTYPLQMAPLRKIIKEDLEVLDANIRAAVKAIVGLPKGTCIPMFYSPRNLRGLAVVNLQWEALLQHHSIANRIAAVDDALVQVVYPAEEEKKKCVEKLGFEYDSEVSTKALRVALRDAQFVKWSKMPYQGQGVKHFSDFKRGNSFVHGKNSLSCSEWTAAIKLNSNYANLRAVPGVGRQGQDNLCRRCGKEQETIKHVLGACFNTEGSRILRHHWVKDRIAALLEEKGFTCIDELQCRDGDGRIRRVDILAFEPDSNQAYIIDPTVRYEDNEDVAQNVQTEKESIYASCADDIIERFPQLASRNFEVIGVWIGSRGTISTSVVEFFRRFELDEAVLVEIAEEVLSRSIGILNSFI